MSSRGGMAIGPGAAPAEEAAEDAGALDERRRAAAYLWAAGGALSLLVVSLPGLPEGANRTPLTLLAAAALAWGVVVIAAGIRFSERAFFAFTVAAILMATAATYFAGPALGPFAAMLFLWAGTYGYYFFSRAWAVVLTALIGVGYALVLVVQPGNPAPVARWLFVMTTVVVVSGLVSWLTHRTRSLVRSEHLARLDADRARSQLAALNETLELRVEDQIDELTRMGELRRFLSPQVADTLLGSATSALLEPHRREIAVLFCDLRGFTAFTSEVEPEEVLGVLGEYYDCVGVLLRKFDATIGPLAGDGVMAYFNDPVPCDDPANRAVQLALAIRSAVGTISGAWDKRGHHLGCGIGLAAGYATLGVIGFEGKRDYGPIGSVVNRASRLCDEARSGQILVDVNIRRQLHSDVDVIELAQVELKGFPRPVPVYAVEEIPAPSDRH